MQVLLDIALDYQRRGIGLYLIKCRNAVKPIFLRSGLIDLIGANRLFRKVNDALAVIDELEARHDAGRVDGVERMTDAGSGGIGSGGGSGNGSGIGSGVSPTSHVESVAESVANSAHSRTPRISYSTYRDI